MLCSTCIVNGNVLKFAVVNWQWSTSIGPTDIKYHCMISVRQLTCWINLTWRHSCLSLPLQSKEIIDWYWFGLLLYLPVGFFIKFWTSLLMGKGSPTSPCYREQSIMFWMWSAKTGVQCLLPAFCTLSRAETAEGIPAECCCHFYWVVLEYEEVRQPLNNLRGGRWTSETLHFDGFSGEFCQNAWAVSIGFWNSVTILHAL